MRTWTPSPTDPSADHALVGLIAQLGLPGFQNTLLRTLAPVIPAASFSLYRLRSGAPQLFMSASHGIADTTVACWRAYLAGPCQNDRTLSPLEPTATQPTRLMHITAQEVPAAHRAQVYDAHGMAERVSVVQSAGMTADGGGAAGVLALNFYRHQHQRAFDDDQLAALSRLAPTLMALVHKQLSLAPPATEPLVAGRQRLQALNPQLTARELDVCARLLLGMTHDGIASDLGIRLPTVKTLRNRAFARLGIHFRSELFARVMPH
jgi:DNA-binding CsgD family transcriptional regulator